MEITESNWKHIGKNSGSNRVWVEMLRITLKEILENLRDKFREELREKAHEQICEKTSGRRGTDIAFKKWNSD